MNGSPDHGCGSCEMLPRRESGPCSLYISPPLGHTLGILRRTIHALGMSWTEPSPQVLAIPIEDGGLHGFVRALFGALTSHERNGTHVLTTPLGEAPGIADIVRARTLDRFIGQIDAGWLSSLLARGGLVTHFQPIVPSSDPGHAFAYECLTRGLGSQGELIPPLQLYRAATDSGILFHLDRAARLQSIAEAARQELTGLVFVNFRPSAIYNPTFCLRSTQQAVTASGLAPEQIVFEVVKTEDVHDVAHLLSILSVYREAGYRIALDDLGAGYSSLNLLHQLRPDFVKLDMGLVRDVDHDPVKATIAAKLLDVALDLGVEAIAEGIETIEEWAWLRDHGAAYQQGFLFAKPAAAPPIPIAPGGTLTRA